MKDVRRAYESAAAFRRALTDRLQKRGRERGEDLQRLHRLVAFDRLLARLFPENASVPWVLKGGCALELRYHLAARATVDVDLAVPRISELGRTPGERIADVLDRLREATDTDLGDGFEVRIEAQVREFTAPPEGGGRFPVVVRLAGRRFANFHLDIGMGDVVLEGAEILAGEELLAFAGIPAARVSVVSVSQQFAEKFHAYTLPRDGRANTRVKDLVDLLIMIERGPLNPRGARAAIEATFARRGTHAIPVRVPDSPAAWEAPYARLAEEAGLGTRSVEAAVRRLAETWIAVARAT
ncbi:MAG: nucleotidyl transferase AbiEii/AbiGii toxin family protein [Acidobacteria bacterium]|nr:nucleotidyl transferase AbiEii/AbiGii toxin family protein [Acidobacteriota bacterium]